MGTNKHYHIQGEKGSRFTDQLRGINLEQVLIVAIDAAKLHQKALVLGTCAKNYSDNTI